MSLTLRPSLLPQSVTSAYKKKLMEMKKWDTIDKLEEEAAQRREDEAAGRGSKAGGKGGGGSGMDAFFSNLLTKNIAMGADVKTAARSAYTVGSKQQEYAFGTSLPASGGGGGGDNDTGDGGGGKHRQEVELEEDKRISSRMVDSSVDGTKLPKRPREEEEDEESGGAVGTGAAELEKRHQIAAMAPAPSPPAAVREEEEKEEGKESTGAAGAAGAAAATVDPAEAKRQKDEAIRKARERFLARKKGGAGGGQGQSAP